MLKALLKEAKTYRATTITSLVGDMTENNLTNYTYPNKEKKITELEIAINTEKAMITSWKNALDAQIGLANNIKSEADWNTLIYAGDYATLVTVRTEAIRVSNLINATSDELKTAHDNLVNAMRTK